MLGNSCPKKFFFFFVGAIFLSAPLRLTLGTLLKALDFTARTLLSISRFGATVSPHDALLAI